jgi:Fe(3+) dicitrate transport protein
MRRRIGIHVLICLFAFGLGPHLHGQTRLGDSTFIDTLRYEPLDITATPLSTDHFYTLSSQALNSAAFSTLNLYGHSLQQIDLQKKPFHLAEKTGRQLFSEIPGAMIYDMDGSGNQINVAIRGLDPHRSWEFNIRQNGLITNSDMYGYPASHYSMPLEAVQSVEIIKGTAALQYGAQFGGMINYTLKDPSSKKIQYESQHNTGSFGLLSTYHSLSGTLGKVQYFSYIQYRQSNGYRQNGESQASAFHGRVIYKPNAHLSITAELSNSQYLYHVPGPLGLQQFQTNPKQSTRSRNYFQPNIYIPGITIQFKPNDKSTLSLVVSGVQGARNSVLFEGFANKLDTIQTLTQQFANRTVDIDRFNSHTAELRYKHLYHIMGMSSSLAIGLRGFNNTMWRRQLGKGTTGSDFDLSTEPNSFKRDLKFHSQSVALSAENTAFITPRWSISPGFRLETGNTLSYGNISYLQNDSIPRNIPHQLPAIGISSEYKARHNNGIIVSGISQAHRPVIFKDIIPGSALERSAQNLKDATGWNAEIAYKNHFQQPVTPRNSGIQHNSDSIWQRFNYSATAYQTQYNNRMGNWVLFDSVNQINYIQKTNIGNSRTRGLELFMAYTLHNKIQQREIRIFNATAFQQAVYTSATFATGGKNLNITGNSLEGVPNVIARTGISATIKSMSVSLLHSYVGEQFSDALNTVTITANGAVGKVPSYGIIDFQGLYVVNKHCQIRFGINNLLNKQYYTKRPTMYPGPGIWPSDGRGVNLGLNLQF